MSKKRKKIRKAGRFSTITTGISTTLVLLLLGIVVLFVTVGTNFSRNIREGLTVEVLLNDSITPSAFQATQTRLKQAPYARKVVYISKEQGTQEMNEALKSDVGEFIGNSPFPAEFEVFLKAEYANLDSIRHYEQSMKAMPGVVDLIYPRDIMDNLDRTIPMVGLILLVIAALLGVISFSLINNTIRMSIYASRYSIHTMKLVGAKWGFIRRPFIGQALRIGLVAALLAGGIIGGALYYLQFEIGEGDIYLNQLITPFVWIATLGSIFLCGILLTVWCAFLSVNHHLRLKTNEVYLK